MKNKRKPRSDKGKLRKPYKHSHELVQSKSDTLKEEMRDIIPMDKKDITYEDLPEKLKEDIQGAINYRISKGLPDDSESRKQKAVNYYKWELEKNK